MMFKDNTMLYKGRLDTLILNAVDNTLIAGMISRS